MNFTLYDRNENVETVDPNEAARNAQLLHDKTVELLKAGGYNNEFVAVPASEDDDDDDGAGGVQENNEERRGLKNNGHKYWRTSVRLTPITDYLLHRPLDSILHKSYQASDAYVLWFCNKLQGN